MNTPMCSRPEATTIAMPPVLTGADRPRPARCAAPAGYVLLSGDNGSELAGAVGSPDRRLPQLGTRADGAGRAQARCRLAQLADLRPAGRASGEVRGEPGALVGEDRVEHVRPGQGVQVGIAGSHRCTPRQSLSLTRPSRILVLTVPAGTPSSSATSA